MKVFAVTLTLGTSKPQSLDFLNEVINELDILLQRGIMLNEKHINIGLKCIVCDDAPAKAMIKGVKLYSGYCGCDRCGQRGVWKGRMTYPEIENLPYRTDLSFRSQTQPEHHRTRSPLCDLPIDMIKSFPIDYMHQACLGVMKRLLLIWMRGKKKETKILFGHIEEISTRLVQLSKFIPKKFARKPRGLDEIDYWKATEYRQFLLYTGKLVLKGVLKKELYEHFLSFSVAMTILVSPVLVENYVEYAKELLVYFVSQAEYLYGEEILVYNVHSMVHLADDAKEYGCLDNCAAFSFENHMQHLKKMIRSGKNLLSQIVKRISELDNLQSKKVETVIPNICNKKPNNAFVLNNHTCCEVVGARKESEINGDKSILCRVYSRGEAIFNMPCDSRIIGGYKFQKRYSQMKMLDVRLLNQPACWWPFNNQSARAGKGEVPDEERWMIYSVRIFASTDSFEMAVMKSKLALDTSNVESEDQGETQTNSPVNVQPVQTNSPVNVQPVQPKSRTIKRPQKYDSIPDEDSDHEDEPPCSSKKVSILPVPPMLSPLNRSLTGENTRPSTSSTSTMRFCTSSSLAALSPEITRPLTLSPAVDWSPLHTSKLVAT
ncbi:unnamed protein product [Mytilus coruscus]|uniref:DUF4218 domain-containing protein n=1 Tax=Mytilus coruscus TaxID=42192 RepID=A0A6J8BU88_MYTCO|nr:unnamed protein product [Mytilus coruscus]